MDCSELNSTEKTRTSELLSEINEIYQESMQSAEATGGSVEKTVILLKEKAERGDSQAAFLLGQLHYEEGRYAEAEVIFDSIKDEDPRALYQLAVIYYDGLGTKEDLSKAIEYMRTVAFWESSEVGCIRYAALYNLGRVFLEGFGVEASSAEAERLWLLAADDGNPNASVKAQSSLGMFYCRPETLDLRKAFSWHSEACGNGSLESQGALGVMYLYGHGVQKDPDAALFCLKEAAERGNVYAQGHLTACYYHRKLYSRAAALGERYSTSLMAHLRTVKQLILERGTENIASKRSSREENENESERIRGYQCHSAAHGLSGGVHQERHRYSHVLLCTLPSTGPRRPEEQRQSEELLHTGCQDRSRDL